MIAKLAGHIFLSTPLSHNTCIGMEERPRHGTIRSLFGLLQHVDYLGRWLPLTALLVFVKLLYRRDSAPLSSSAAAEGRCRRVARILLGPVWDTGQ
jgi:hypothetical protein